MTDLPDSWAEVEIVEVLEPNENAKPFQQGWSPQCESFPASVDGWGVLKTTAIQHGEFRSHENKALPNSMEPRPAIEVRPGDVLMTCAGPRNRCGIACLVEHTRPRLMLSGKMYQFRPHPTAMLPKYLAFLIQRRETQLSIDRMKTGISDSGLNLTHDRFAKLKVPIPPLPEQRRIVAKIEELFSELDASAENFMRARTQLKTYRQALLKAAFDGKLTADWRAANVDKLETATNLSSRIRAERLAADKSEPADTAAVPSDSEAAIGWVWCSLDSVAAGSLIGLVRSAGQQNSKGEGVNYIKMDRIGMDGNVSIWPEVFVLADEDEIERYALRRGDILFNTRNSVELVGKAGLIRSEPETPTVFNNNLMRIRPIPSVRSDFLAYQMCAHSFRQRMERIKKATTSVAAVYGKDLWPLPILVPGRHEQIEIVRILDEKLSIVDTASIDIEVNLRRAAALRQSILDKAFMGQLVPQDPSDERAAALLDRLRAQSSGANSGRKTRRKQFA